MTVALATAAPTSVRTPFVPPANYREFLAFDPRYIFKFLKSRRCPEAVFEDFEQSLHTHLMSIGKTGASRGHADKLAEYTPSLRGNATTLHAWADWVNTILGREYGKLINRNKRGGIRGENVISLSDPIETITVMDAHDRLRLTDEAHTTLTTKVFVSTFLDYVREEGGEDLYVFAQNLMIYDTATEAGAAMGITGAKALTLRTRMREIGERFKRGC